MTRFNPSTAFARSIGLVGLLAGLAGAASIVHAADDGVVEAGALPEYEVRATRLDRALNDVPAAVGLVESTAIQRANRQLTLDESLQTVPGVFVLNPYNYAQDTRIAIRGFGARSDFGIRGIRLIVDGIPATTPDGQGEVDGLDLGSAERIEVLRGPASALYGSASGGVIRIETEDGPPIPFLETRWSAGEHGFLNAQFKAGGQADALNYLLSGAQLRYEGYRAHSDTENTKLNGKLSYRLGERAGLQLVFNLIDFPRQDDPGGLTLAEARADPEQARQRNVDFDSGESVEQQRVGLQYAYDLDESRRLEARVYYTHRDFANKLPFEDGGQVAYERNFFGGGLLYRFDGDRWTVSGGVDFDSQNDARQNFDNLAGSRGPLALDQQERVESVGIFASQAYRIFEDVELSAALRYDRVGFEVEDDYRIDGDDSGDLRFSEWSPMAGLSWKVDDALTLYANLSSAFETPTTTEFDNPVGGGFNTDLQSQQAWNFEIGAKGGRRVLDRRVSYAVALFQVEIEDALVPYELEAFPGREFYRNAGESRRRGLEAALSAELGAGWSLGLNYTWSDFRYERFREGGDDFSGNRLPGIPEHYANLRVDYLHPGGFFASWRTRFVGAFYADDGNRTRIEEYSVSELRIGYTYERGNWTVEPYLGLNNLFDERYFANIRINAFGGRYYEPAPERNWFGGIRVRYRFE